MLRKIAFDIRRTTFRNGSIMSRNSRLSHPPSIMVIRCFSDLPDYIPLEMPALSPTMESGGIASWMKKEGDHVDVGEVMAEVETDKATVAWESVEEGYLAKIILPDGATDVAVGTLAGIFVEEEEDIAAFKDFTGDAAPSPVAEPAPATPEPSPVVAATPAATPTPTPVASSSTSGRIIASPSARRVANERKIDLSTVTGTGPGGRIIKADIDEYKGEVAAVAAAPVTAPAVSAPAAIEGEYTDLPHTNVRKIIADRLTQSKQQIPHYYVSIEVQMDNALRFRKKLNSTDKDTKISVNDFIIKASSLALRDVPEVNSSWFDDVIRQYNYVDVCVAVATDGGLITPIVQDADLKGLATISKDVRSLAARARENKLQPHEYQGGTFTISNLGMMGVKSFTAIINPPQACILAVGTSEKKVIVNENEKYKKEYPYTTGSFMTVTLSCDHRVVDGAVGAQWLASFKSYMENPATMLL